jgi:hypothetical protein
MLTGSKFIILIFANNENANIPKHRVNLARKIEQK